MFRPAFACLFTFLVIGAAGPLRAQTCQQYVNTAVKDNVESVLNAVLKDRPDLRDLTQEQLVKTAGEQLITADDAKLRVHGYMMLMWYGDEESRKKLAEHAAALETEAGRANFYFVMGMNLLRSKKPDASTQGRDYIRQMRETGHVTSVNDVMWDNLIEGCTLPN
ncbi:MAG: hypothetical protein AB7U38_12310 [Hyphomicrobiales bacterium]